MRYFEHSAGEFGWEKGGKYSPSGIILQRFNNNVSFIEEYPPFVVGHIVMTKYYQGVLSNKLIESPREILIAVRLKSKF